ncbi:MAG: 50S ribosomal protein L18 [Brevinemataceae bacterium]
MIDVITKKTKRYYKRKLRSRKNLRVSSERPRLTVFRSSKYLYAQVFDISNKVLVSYSSISKDLGQKRLGNNIESATIIGTKIGEKLKQLNITKVVFDRNGYLYHGKVKAIADACRAAGIEF